ncbi:hypothetical protein BT69DRAFT_1260593 [Atractiella rhizophila]|nr:hypothetical protein BT69DRAFT_1260593 [Atractiella rhizophila]
MMVAAWNKATNFCARFAPERCAERFRLTPSTLRPFQNRAITRASRAKPTMVVDRHILSSEDPELVIRKVNDNITTFSKPFYRYILVPIGGRSVSIRLKNNTHLVLASTPLTPATLAAIQPQEVSYLFSPDDVHYLYLRQWAKAFPNAKLLAPKKVTEMEEMKGLEFYAVWKDGEKGLTELEGGEVLFEYFETFKNKDIALYHTPSKTLVLADLIFNLPADEQYSKSTKSSTPWFLGGRSMVSIFQPAKWFHDGFVASMHSGGKDTTLMRESARRVASWDIEKIIPCHGDVIESKGGKIWKLAYARYLDLKEKKKTE